jgi:hypothetical protein
MEQTPISGRFIPDIWRGPRIFPGNYEAVNENEEYDLEGTPFDFSDDSDSDENSNVSSATAYAMGTFQQPPPMNEAQDNARVNPNIISSFDSPPNSASPQSSSGESVYGTPMTRSLYSEGSTIADAQVSHDATEPSAIDTSQNEELEPIVSSDGNSPAQGTPDGGELPVRQGPIPACDDSLPPTEPVGLPAPISDHSTPPPPIVVAVSNDEDPKDFSEG